MKVIPLKTFYFVLNSEIDVQSIELTKNGIDQAYNAGFILKDLEVSIIISSLDPAAVKTAEYINDYCNTEVKNISINGNEENIISTLSDILLSNQIYVLLVADKKILKILFNILIKKEISAARNGDIFLFMPSIIEKNIWDLEKLSSN